ncbi:MAG: hypothetical protein WCE69_15180, partial [Aestuariivirga sp.]
VRLAESFEDPRLRQLANRLIYVENAGALDAATKVQFDRAIARRLLMTGKVPWLTLPRAIEEANHLLETAGGGDADRIRELAEYLKARMSDAVAIAEHPQ